MQFSLLFLALVLSGFASAKTTEGDCVECNARKQKIDSFHSKGIQNVIDKIGSVPAALPANSQVASMYGGHKSEVMKPGYPWNSVGRLLIVNNKIDFCTATRVSACHVISAAHCVRNAKGEIEPTLVFVPPFDKDKLMVEKDKILTGAANYLEDRGEDWAVMRVTDDSATGKRDGWLGIKDRRGTELVGKKFSYVGYNEFLTPKAREAYIDVKAEVLRTAKGYFSGNPNSIYVRANSGPGGSGGPLFEFDTEGKAWIVGMCAAGVVSESGQDIFLDADEKEAVGQCAAANAFLTKVQKFIAENPCN
jgi:V8-like Glu-specific endopeptidase